MTSLSKFVVSARYAISTCLKPFSAARLTAIYNSAGVLTYYNKLRGFPSYTKLRGIPDLSKT